MFRYALALLIFIAGATIAGGIYKWIDEYGKTHYSDSPVTRQNTSEKSIEENTLSDKTLTNHVSSSLTPKSENPALLCQQEKKPKWLHLFCHFFTEQLWLNSGKPTFFQDKKKVHWTPFFNTKTGILEGLKKFKSPNSGIRYAPWSSFFKKRYQCSENSIINPFIFYKSNDYRSRLLGLNWEIIRYDHFDPSNDMEEGAMFMLFTLATLNKIHDEKKEMPLDDMLTNIALGKSKFYPDYSLAEEMTLVTSDGSFTPLTSTKQAAQKLAEHRVLYTNDFMKTWNQGLNNAKTVAAANNKSLIYFYMAQDVLSLPLAQNTLYRQKLTELINQTQKLISQKKQLVIMSHGWSGYLVTSTLVKYKNIFHIALGPFPGPWHKEEYIQALKSTQLTMNIRVGAFDFISPLGYGSNFLLKKAINCL